MTFLDFQITESAFWTVRTSDIHTRSWKLGRRHVVGDIFSRSPLEIAAHDAVKRCLPATDLLVTMGSEREPKSGVPSEATTAAIAKAAMTGDIEVFTSVLRFFEDTLGHDQVQ